jgi:hypothetical protein
MSESSASWRSRVPRASHGDRPSRGRNRSGRVTRSATRDLAVIAAVLRSVEPTRSEPHTKSLLAKVLPPSTARPEVDGTGRWSGPSTRWEDVSSSL